MTNNSYNLMRDEMIRSLGFGAHVNDQHRFAIEWLFAKHDAFEKDVLERLAKLERKTSSREDVTLHEELRDLGNGIKEGRSLKVRWHEPYPPKPVSLVGLYEGDGHPAARAGYEPTEETEEP